MPFALWLLLKLSLISNFMQAVASELCRTGGTCPHWLDRGWEQMHWLSSPRCDFYIAKGKTGLLEIRIPLFHSKSLTAAMVIIGIHHQRSGLPREYIGSEVVRKSLLSSAMKVHLYVHIPILWSPVMHVFRPVHHFKILGQNAFPGIEIQQDWFFTTKGLKFIS